MGILLWPDGKQSTIEHTFSGQTINDLQLQQIFDQNSFNHYYKLSMDEIIRLWTSDAEVIRYRQEILRDLDKNPGILEMFEDLLDNIDSWDRHSGRGRHNGDAEHYSIDMWNFSFLESYIQKLGELREHMSAMTIEAQGLLNFRKRIQKLYDSTAFQSVSKVFQENYSGYAMPERITLGINLNRSLNPVTVKLLRIPEHTQHGRRMSLTPSAVLSARTVAAKAVTEAGNDISAFVSNQSRELRAIKQDIIFYLTAMAMRKSWHEYGLESCLPVLGSEDEKCFEATGMFNPLLVCNHASNIVTNDINFKKNGELLILTGANQGGKTVFLQSVALIQWFAQLGIWAPCSTARLSVANQILTVFSPMVSGSSAIRGKGLLSEEVKRISDAIKQIDCNSMVFFNEPLNATSPSENLYISEEVLAAIKAAGVRGIWVTHLYELAADRVRLNNLINWGSSVGSIHIIVRSSPDGIKSTYHIERGEPEFKSYASEVLRRGGISFE